MIARMCRGFRLYKVLTIYDKVLTICNAGSSSHMSLSQPLILHLLFDLIHWSLSLQWMRPLDEGTARVRSALGYCVVCKPLLW
jgi:hypothetical protein